MLTPIIGVIILLGGLIFFHELGHYSVAKFFKVKVEVFSLGFGKKILKWTWGETEYALSLVPLGGYVKLMGDDPHKPVAAEDAARAFSTQKLYKRFAIVAAGPLANLILAYFLFVGIFFLGQPQAGTRVGSVIVGSPAWVAGIRTKDRIADVDSKPVQTWKELEEKLRGRVGDKVDLGIERGSVQLKIPFTIGKVRSRNVYGEEEEIGGIKGVSPIAVQAMIGISNPETPAYKAGLRTNDLIVRIDSKEVVTLEDANEVLTSIWKENQPVTFSVKRPVSATSEETTDQSFTVVLPKLATSAQPGNFGPVETLGLYPVELFVRKVSEGSPAEKGGLQAGDRIVRVGGQDVYNFEAVLDHIQEQGAKGSEVNFLLERAGKPVTLNLKPMSTVQEDPLTHQPVNKFLVGFMPSASYGRPEIVYVTYRDPIKLLTRSFTETVSFSKQMVISIWKLITRQISAKNLGGPIMIASVAGESLEAGLVPFLHTMALISLNLFLLNLLPVPVLDGGHLLFFSIEAIKGKPVSVKTMELATQVGMVLILALVGLTLFNDITRKFLN